MNANWILPVLTSNYANFLAEMKSRDEDIAIWFDNTTSENLPNKTKRWNSSGGKFEIWDGTTWSDLSNLYEIKVRDSDKLNGQTASYYAVANHGHTAATTTANGFMSSTDKIKLNNIAEDANNYSHPTGDGNLHVPANGIANNGKFLQATSVAGVYIWASLPTSSLSTLGINATAAELNILDGATVSTAELNILDGVLITAEQLNYLSALTGNVQTQLNAKAALASPALTGTPTAPTATVGTNNTQIATTAFVLANITNTVVGTANAGLSAGAIGSYTHASIISGALLSLGGTIAGSGINAGNSKLTGGSVLTGTWRYMGRGSTSQSTESYGLFLRIA
ncbi:hypothetical protein CKA55_07545 [Arcobacter suis]|uniref:Tail fiber protein n=1 Tax=Arcobacter suis CECT 7833 TaxID=663365 RepID=A0AAD0SPY9_9BACT|nr:hypothetical protein [Arcobacter suis]AXX89350.1 hypothetical protein ASUIS_0859 [Arcobacter suis CECT 7833]RWS46584.1 hypothetical protein CKA55_07545 [Arcobacter suis]